jgi:hypothetical protein
LSDPTKDQPLEDEDLSPFFIDADTNSNAAQARHVAQFRGQLALLVIAACSGVASFRWEGQGPDWAGVFGAVAFGAAIFLRLHSEQQHDEQQWYECRAAAESAKTLCWRYAVAGNPFPEILAEHEARRLLIDRFAAIGKELDYVDPSQSGSSTGEVTSRMNELRHAARPVRIRAYSLGRVQGQLSWYSNKAKENSDKARLWLKIAVAAEGFGLMGAVLKATALVSVDLLGVFSAIAAAAGAWLQMRQHRTLASAYALTARELRQIATLVDENMNADEWAHFVDQAEEAISREHTMWVASRTGRRR